MERGQMRDNVRDIENLSLYGEKSGRYKTIPMFLFAKWKREFVHVCVHRGVTVSIYAFSSSSSPVWFLETRIHGASEKSVYTSEFTIFAFVNPRSLVQLY